MKKLFLVGHGLGSNGIDSFVLNVARSIDKQCFEVYVVMAVDDNGYQQFREQEAIDAGVCVLRTCDLSGIQSKFRHCKKLYQLLCKEKPDVVHSNMDLLNGVNLFIAWLAHISIRVSHSHTSKSQYEENTGKHFWVALYRTLMRKMIWLFSTDRLGCSAPAMNYLYGDKWISDSSSKILPNGIDLSKFASSEPWKGACEFGQNKILLTVGRLSAVKNPDYIIEIMRRISAHYKLIWVGDGELKDAIKEKIVQYHLEEKIYLVGAQSNVAPFYKCADAFIFPSIFEGLPITLIEAQAAEIPCFVSKNVTQEVDCGYCEYLDISEKNLDNWVDRLQTFKRNDFCLNSEKIKRFSINNMISELNFIYSK